MSRSKGRLLIVLSNAWWLDLFWNIRTSRKLIINTDGSEYGLGTSIEVQTPALLDIVNIVWIKENCQYWKASQAKKLGAYLNWITLKNLGEIKLFTTILASRNYSIGNFERSDKSSLSLIKVNDKKFCCSSWRENFLPDPPLLYLNVPFPLFFSTLIPFLLLIHVVI